MRWFKQNMVLAVGGLITLVLMLYGGYYLFQNIGKNKEVEGELDQYQEKLKGLYQEKIFPSPTNITAARKEVANVRSALTNAQRTFGPVPAENVTGLKFKTLLDTTLYELQKGAESAGVTLPDKGYAFSFSNEKIAMQFPPSSFPALPEQLAEVKAICDILYSAKINKLTSVKRVKVGDATPQPGVPGAAGAGADYLDAKIQLDPALNMIFNPYQVEFESFTPELAMVLENFGRSKYALLVKAVMVESELPIVTPPNQTQPGVPGRPPPPRYRPAPGAPRPVAPGANRTAPAAAPKDSLTPVLNEKLVKVTLLVEAARPAAPAAK